MSEELSQRTWLVAVIMPAFLWQITGELGQLSRTQRWNKRLVPHMMEGEGQQPRLSSDLHAYASTHTHTEHRCAHAYTHPRKEKMGNSKS